MCCIAMPACKHKPEGDCWNNIESIYPPTDAEDAFRKINSVGELICQPEQVMM